MLQARQAQILRLIIDDYIASANPVGSATIVRRHGLGVSSATVRHAMAELEEQGYINHPHTSAGRIPSDKGYRYYVETLMEEEDVDVTTRVTVQHQFHQVTTDLEEWVQLAASVLSRLTGTAALVSRPRSPQVRLRRLELVMLQEFLALMVMVLQESRLKRQLVSFEEPVTQEGLDQIAQRMNASLAGRSLAEVGNLLPPPAGPEQQVWRAATRVLQSLEEEAREDVYVDGLRQLLRQPEFSRGERGHEVLELLADPRVLGEILPRLLAGEGVRVLIGAENEEETMRECSLILTRYGGAEVPGGLLGLLGPTRLPYERAIPTVRFMGEVMESLLAEIYHA